MNLRKTTKNIRKPVTCLPLNSRLQKYFTYLQNKTEKGTHTATREVNHFFKLMKTAFQKFKGQLANIKEI